MEHLKKRAKYLESAWFGTRRTRAWCETGITAWSKRVATGFALYMMTTRLLPGGLEVLRRACALAGEPALIVPTETQTECDESFRYRFRSPGAWSVLHCSTIPSGAVIHRKIVQELGVFNPRFCYSADLEYFPRIAAHFPVVIIDSPLAVRYQLHDSNYQTKTWKKADFYPQLEEIQRSIVSYAGIKGPVAESLVQQRLTSLLEYVLREAHRRGDQILIRQYAQLLETARHEI